MTSPPHRVRQIEQVSSLDDTTRRALYDFVAGQGDPVSRDQVSTALDLDRSVAAYHLDRLVELGLLAATYARPDGKGGPGAGRPAKHYARVDVEVAVTLPPRDYRLVAELLLRAVDADDTGTVRRALDGAAADLGATIATGRGAASPDGDEGGDNLVTVLQELGFEPYDDAGTLRLRNCPFHALAQAHTDVVCGMNLRLLDAIAGTDERRYSATLDPAPGRCCVAFEPAQTDRSGD